MSRQGRRAEPRFDVDLKWGQEAERKIRQLFRCFVSNDPRVEVKRKRYLDLRFYIETHCDKGRTGTYVPSGIHVTTAELWAFVLDASGVSVLIPTRLVKAALEEPSSRDAQETDGSCPTRGKLIDFAVLVYRLKQARAAAEAGHTPAPVHAGPAPPLTHADIAWEPNFHRDALDPDHSTGGLLFPLDKLP